MPHYLLRLLPFWQCNGQDAISKMRVDCFFIHNLVRQRNYPIKRTVPKYGPMVSLR